MSAANAQRLPAPVHRLVVRHVNHGILLFQTETPFWRSGIVSDHALTLMACT